MEVTEIIKNAGYESLTPMQEKYLENSETAQILLAHTGTGKTLAYLLQLLLFLKKSKTEKVLIICPTRELALQVHKSLSTLRTGISSTVCYGGHSFKDEKLQLKANPQVIIGTPGRLLDHLERNSFQQTSFDHWIIDEYDKTLEFGFIDTLEDMYHITKKPKTIQLISATVIENLPDFLKDFNFKTFSFLSEEKPEISFFKLAAPGHDKLFALRAQLSILPPAPTLIFCSHREAAERIGNLLNEVGKSCSIYHGGFEQFQRETALLRFRNGSENCMVCTDLAARGLDIPDVAYVFHYQFPPDKESFTHRNGRTARMQKNGIVYLLHSENEPLPSYCSEIESKAIQAPDFIENFKSTDWITLRASSGRKQKLRKVDFVGFFLKDLGIEAKSLGIIDVLDNESYIAISRDSFQFVKKQLDTCRIKGKKVMLREFRK
jgi:superfamily II DNA/RNA helicase